MSTSSGQWIVDSIHSFHQQDVGSLVPPVFDAYARVFHPAYQRAYRRKVGQPYPLEIPVPWRDVAKANHRSVHPKMQWGSLVGSWNTNRQPGIWDRAPADGRLPVPETRELSRILKKHLRVDRVMYALWNGYGGMQLENADLIELPYRSMYVVNGSIDDAVSPFGITDRTANLWWPDDHQWCVATDIDLVSTYIGGSAQCIEAVVGSATLEAMEVTSDQSIAWESDTLNPPPEPPYLSE